MNPTQLRHHAWNRNEMARAAETHARYAMSDTEAAIWNEIVLHELHCAELLEAEADRLDGRARLPFRHHLAGSAIPGEREPV